MMMIRKIPRMMRIQRRQTMSSKTAKKVVKRARVKDEDQQEEARRAIKQKANRFNNTDYGPTEEFYPNDLRPQDIEKRTCSFCGNRFPHELQSQIVEKLYRKGKKMMSYKPPKVSENRICASPSCRRLVQDGNPSNPTVLVHHE